jgi:Zn-dependent M28 family amino/carboxypeptidase
MKKITAFLLLFSFSFPLLAQDRSASFSADKMRERIKRLSSDEFEGRGPGAPGGLKAAQYIADELKAAGVKPGNKKSYFQNVKLVGIKADPNSVLEVGGAKGNSSFKFAEDFVATTGAQADNVSIDNELVFAGYGIDAPLYKWNDFKGGTDAYKGKILMIMVNDPPATTDEPGLFGGKALTYYGRWTYKFEEAARKGAAGVILIHTDESAGYGWNVVRTSNGSWRYEIAREKGDTSPYLNLKSWVTNGAAGKMLSSAGLNIDDLRKKAKSRDFQPVSTGLKVKLNLKSEMKVSDSPNVVGVVEGSDSKLKKEYVIYTGHWDHLGIGEANANGDRIYNGAYDNSSGVATIIGIAEALARMSKKERPKRSILFLFPTAEEQGLLGAEYYSQRPLVPLNKTAANVNIDGVNFFGRVKDFMPLGADRSSISKAIEEAAKERGLTLESDMRPEQGFFYRSDHFPFAKVGVPAVSLQHGDDFVKPLTGEAKEFSSNYTARHYHQVSDEYHDWWDMDAMIQEAEFGLAIGIKLANDPVMPRYKDTDEFSAPDKARMK